MTTEELDQVQSQPIADSESSEVSISEEKSIEKSTLLSNDASVSTLMNNYIEKGWITLNDGCPDCNTPLMRNQEATSQVCVNCEINPPLDPEEKEGPQQDAQKESLEQQVQTPPSKPSSAQLITLPPPTSPLPPLPAPEPIRPLSPPNARTSSLDPIMDAMRRIVRSPPSKPTPSDVPHRPPRPTTPLPKPPKTPPPTARPKLAVKPPTPLLPGNSSLISPPSSPQAPKLMPRDKRRSPQSSMVPNSIQPPTRPSPSSSVPTSPSTETAMTYLSNVGTVPGLQDKGSQLINTVFSHAEVEMPSEAHMQTHEFEDVEGKGQESHDEFEDAEEEMVIRSADEVKVRESSRDQNDKITRLMGQKMLQGWTMLQETCPNPKCNRVPLMRSREKKEYCVVCEGKYPITPSTARPATHVESQLAHTSTEQKPIIKSASQLSEHSTTMPSFPRPSSPPTIPIPGSNHHHRAISPLTSPNNVRPTRDLNGRISSPIVLPPPVPISPSFGMTSQKIYQSDELDKHAAEEEDVRRHMQLIGKVNEFSSRSLPPVPPVPVIHSTNTSRPTSTYSNGSDKERQSRHHHHSQGHSSHSSGNEGGAKPLSPEVQSIVDAAHKTMSTLLTKLEVYRLALEVTENPKESQALTVQIKGLMECLKACREVL